MTRQLFNLKDSMECQVRRILIDEYALRIINPFTFPLLH
jgi:hypothetical protein